MAEQRVRRVPKPAPDAAEAHAGVFDRVFMHDLVQDVEIGVYTNEKGVTQRVRFSVDVELMPATAALNDDIGRAFDYDTIVKGIKDIVARGHINLVETLAERIAQHCLAHPRAARVTVMIEKLDKEPGAVGVEIVRSKGSV
jgi:dihydroneopterin aldolase